MANPKPRWRLIAGAVIFALASSVMMPVAASAATTTTEVVLEPTAASWTSSRYPSTPLGDKPYLSASSSADTSYLKFDGAGLAGKKVVKASLELNVSYSTATTGGVLAYPTSTSWSEQSLTYNNRPALGASAINTALVPAKTGAKLQIPVSNLGAVVAKPMAFGLQYSQKYVSNNFSLAKNATPKLRVTVETGTTAVAPAPAPAAPVTKPSASNGKKVFAHYFPPYPISIENGAPATDYYAKNYLTANGENGIHASYGGLLRDRPVGRAPLAGSDWELQDLKTEVRQAMAAGIDGFTLNIMSTSGRNWTASVNLMKAAAAVSPNFTIIPMIDGTANVGSQTGAQVAAKLAELYAYSSAEKVAGGAYALSSFKAENKSVSWWSSIISALKSRGITVSFSAIFLNASDANMKAFAPISDGVGNWGTRTALTITNGPDYAARAHALGLKWMAPVAVQDVRPRSFIYDEANNTETLRASWDRAIATGADSIQMATWNDYSESTQFAPSFAHGTTFLDISRYYIDRYKTGSTTVTADAMYVTHRVHPYAAAPTTVQKLMSPTLSGTATAPRNTVEVLTMLTAPANVTVTVGGASTTYSAPAGVYAKTVPLAVGKVSASANRNGSAIATVSSPYTVTSNPKVQDLQYYGVSSKR
ncbi:endo-1,3-alpha-glucanase family glycosylhydrolase [Mycetocola zhadangensis]|uniref:endo-1,3-alpha-glucanase family glycosylhydrolase n=1 Tax=Mycetocola zhadangensis TaxID=1164595 RepID=UPI003A4DF7A8